jgi:hypothetical protein
VVDGGQPLVKTRPRRVLADLGITRRGAVRPWPRRLEEVWLPGEDFPVVLPAPLEALYLLQTIP